MASEEEIELSISKTKELLLDAQQLMRDIEELLGKCTLSVPAKRKRRRTIQQECEAFIEEDGETLVIEGFRFESATSREKLRRLSSEAGTGGHQGST